MSKSIAVLAMILFAATARAEVPSELGFLKVGEDYVIRFAEGSDIFKTTRTEVTQSTYVTDDGQKKSGDPVTWTIRLSVRVFEVVQIGGGSWVRLRHPASIEDSAKWFGKRRAMAILASDRAAEIEKEQDGGKKLAKLREAAARDIKTDETWVNLAHAVAITDVPTEKVELKMSVTSAKAND